MDEKLLKIAKQLRILYVEDDDASRELFQSILEEYFGNVTFACDGQDGLTLFQKEGFNLIITDINMPKMNGFEMIKRIRQKNDDIPVLILSAYSDTHHFIQAIELHVSGYILKPVQIEQMECEFSRIVKNISLQQELKERQYLLEQYQQIVDASLIVSKTDINGIITYSNDNFSRISEYSKEELIGKSHNIIRHTDNPKELYHDLWHTISVEKKLWTGVIKNRKKSGGSYYVKSYIKPILDTNGNILEYIALRNDITEIMNPRKQLRDILKAIPDPLLLYMKLDEFAIVTELFEHDIIEMIEKKLAQKIAQHLPFALSEPKVFQLGEGEFASVLDARVLQNNQEKELQKIHDMLHSIKKEVINLGEFEYSVSLVASISCGNDKLIENAKLGITKVLQEGGCLLVANDLVDQEEALIQKNMQTLVMIQKALEHDRIISYFQPIVDNQTRQTVKYESLVRLVDQNGKVIPPFFFLDTAKKGRYYTHITKKVIQNSFEALHKIKHEISINVSALDIENMEISHYILELLEKNRKDASRLVFELLEDENVKNIQTIIGFIKKVKSFGVKIAIDDFGSGYSNYERLLEYQPDILKIDGSLVRNIQTDDYSLSIVKSIVTFAKEQHFQTVAEFVENEEIFKILKNLGVDFSQGFYFSKPKPLAEI